MPEFASNQSKFAALRELDLPIGHYAITGSGPLGVRDLRAIRDIDLLLTPELWSKLATTHDIVKDHEVVRLRLSDEIEAVGAGSLFISNEIDGLSAQRQIEEAELIDGLPFVRLENIRYFKLRRGQDKDLADVKLIDAYLRQRK